MFSLRVAANLESRPRLNGLFQALRGPKTGRLLSKSGCIYRHPRSLLPGTVVRIPDQYAGLPLNGPIRCPEPVARRIPVPEVEVRPLAVYEALVGGEAR